MAADVAPTAVANSYSVNEDTLLTVAVGTGLLVNDTDPESDPLTAVLVSDVANGDLGFNADGSFTYLPAANFNGSDSFSYKANDGLRDSNVVTVTISVNAVNDAPLNSLPAVADTSKGVTLVFSSANGNPISISDSDAAAATVQVQLTGTNGTVSLSGTGGLSFAFSDANGTGAGDGTADATMTFRGTIGNINAALAGMSFIPTSTFSGAATLQVVTKDLGNTGSGGNLTDTDSLAITVYSLGIFTTNGDVGTTGIVGSTTFSGGTYTVKGGGADIWGTTDAFQFVYRTMTGDGQLTAKVLAVQNTAVSAKGGVMFRDTTGATSVMALADIEGTAGAESIYRATTGASATGTVLGGISAPYWVRMTRIGSTFLAERSPDGVTWTAVGATQTITMGSTINVGLVVTSHVAGTLNTSTFDNVSFDTTAPTADFTTPNEGTTTLQAATSYTIAWTESDGSGIGVATTGGRSLQRWKGSQSSPGSCAATAWSTDGAPSTAVSSVAQSPLVTGTCYRWVQTLADFAGNTAGSTSGAVLIDTTAPSQPNVTGSGTNVYQSSPNSAIWFKGGATGTISLSSSSTDPTSGINKHNYGALSAGTGWTYASGDIAGNPAAKNATWGATSGTTNVTLTPYNGALTAGTARTVTLTADSTAPAISAFTPSANATQSSTTVTPTWTETEGGSGVASRSLQRRTGAQSPAASCATTTWANDGGAVNVASGVAQTGLTVGSCYQWTLTVTDRVGNTSGLSTSSWILIIGPPALTTTVADLAYTENDGAVPLDAGITATDPDSMNLASASVTITTNYVTGQDTLAFVNQNGITGTWTPGTGVMALTGSATVANYQIALRTMTYTNTSDAPNSATRTVTFVANDGTANSNTATRNVTITAINDAPSGTDKTVTTNEDTGNVFTTADFEFGDTTDGGVNALLAVKITTLPATGSLTLSGVPVTVAQFVSAASITSGLLVFTPAANANGAANASFTFQVQDNGGVVSGGVDLDQSANTMTVTVTAVNDVPSFTKGADQIVLKNAVAQSVAAWATSVTAGPVNELGQSLDFIVSNDNNALFSAQPAINATGTLSLTPAADVTGMTTVTVQIHDDGGTAGGGVDTSAAQTFVITVSDGAYVSSSGWPTSFDSSRYLKLTFPAYVPAGSVVTSATFRHEYRSATAGDTTCYYFEVWSGVTLLATHGSAGSPLSCNATASYASDAVLLPEVDTVAEANNVTIKLFVWNSGGRSSQHRTATLGVVSSLD